MYTLGIDVGSSSVKAALINIENGLCVASSHFPETEAPIISCRPGWAEQEPENWWKYLQEAVLKTLKKSNVNPTDIKAIGVSYQMHGLVCVNKKQEVLRPSIIWCDSRAVPYGEQAFAALGQTYCMDHLLNSPGNFTAAKLAWVRQNEPDIYEQIDKIMLPGDYIIMKMTGDIRTTISGLSEGILWDFKDNTLAYNLLEHYQIDASLIPTICPTFGEQGLLSEEAAQVLHLQAGTPITYRAGDQPNNAFSLNVLQPGEIASTAGTSGVVYGINDSISYDPWSRTNNFAHVNHTHQNPRLGVLLCINGTGILNSWCKHHIAPSDISYDDINRMAATSPVGCKGVSILPFGNGAERVLKNKEIGCSIHGIGFNSHAREDVLRAVQEGIVFAFKYGIDIMQKMGISVQNIHAGYANMFMSPLFREALATTTGACIQLYDTDGAVGAAKAAGLGAQLYNNTEEAFQSLKCITTIDPITQQQEAYLEAYNRWKERLEHTLNAYQNK